MKGQPSHPAGVDGAHSTVLFGNALDPLSSVSAFIFFRQVRGLQSPRTESVGGGGRKESSSLQKNAHS